MNINIIIINISIITTVTYNIIIKKEKRRCKKNHLFSDQIYTLL